MDRLQDNAGGGLECCSDGFPGGGQAARRFQPEWAPSGATQIPPGSRRGITAYRGCDEGTSIAILLSTVDECWTIERESTIIEVEPFRGAHSGSGSPSAKRLGAGPFSFCVSYRADVLITFSNSRKSSKVTHVADFRPDDAGKGHRLR